MKKLIVFVFALVALLGLSSCGAKEYKLGMGIVVSDGSEDGTAQVDATVAAVVLEGDKIVACRIDAVQNKIKVSETGTIVVPESFKTKMELKEAYGMATSQWSSDNNGDNVIKEWYEQVNIFETYVTGKTADQVANLELKDVNDHKISADDSLLTAGCTIQITDFIAAIVKACNDDQAVTFTAKDFTLGVAASSYDYENGSKSATADANGVIQVYSDFAASVVSGGKIVVSLNDAIQPSFAVSATGELTYTFTKTKRELKGDYGMATSQWSSDNNGDNIIKEWYEQSAVFSKYVEGKTATDVANLGTKTLDSGYVISNDDALLSAGCTIQITGMMEVVAKSVNYAR